MDDFDFVLDLSDAERAMLVVAVGSFGRDLFPVFTDEGKEVLISLVSKIFEASEGRVVSRGDVVDLLSGANPFDHFTRFRVEAELARESSSKPSKLPKPLHFG